MRRRELMLLLGGAMTVGRALCAAEGDACVSAVPMLPPRPVGTVHARLPPGLSETGYLEGQNLVIEYCRAEGHSDRLPAHWPPMTRVQDRPAENVGL